MQLLGGCNYIYIYDLKVGFLCKSFICIKLTLIVSGSAPNVHPTTSSMCWSFTTRGVVQCKVYRPGNLNTK